MPPEASGAHAVPHGGTGVIYMAIYGYIWPYTTQNPDFSWFGGVGIMPYFIPYIRHRALRHFGVTGPLHFAWYISHLSNLSLLSFSFQ